MTLGDVDLVEINEAFAAQVIPSARGLGIDPFDDRLNARGGSIALATLRHDRGAHPLHPASTVWRPAAVRSAWRPCAWAVGLGMAMILERLT